MGDRVHCTGVDRIATVMKRIMCPTVVPKPSVTHHLLRSSTKCWLSIHAIILSHQGLPYLLGAVCIEHLGTKFNRREGVDLSLYSSALK